MNKETFPQKIFDDPSSKDHIGSAISFSNIYYGVLKSLTIVDQHFSVSCVLKSAKSLIELNQIEQNRSTILRIYNHTVYQNMFGICPTQ